MTELRPLTLLQRSVITKLREAGLGELAHMARSSWRLGERCPIEYRAIDRGKDERVPDALRADFDKANEQALQSR